MDIYIGISMTPCSTFSELNWVGNISAFSSC